MITDNSAVTMSMERTDGDLIFAIFPEDLPDDYDSDDCIYASLKELCLEEIAMCKTLDQKIPKDETLILKNMSKNLKLLAKMVDEEIKNNSET